MRCLTGLRWVRRGAAHQKLSCTSSMMRLARAQARGFLVHELRNALGTATSAASALELGK